nr:matrilin-3-like [Parasteatoda tepidariorum]
MMGSFKLCTCNFDYMYNPGTDQCEKCDCGPNSDSCTMINSLKFCTCISGYTFNPRKFNCEKLPCDGLSALESVMYFSPVGFVLGLINYRFLIKLFCKRCRDKKRDEAETRVNENV